MPDESTSLKDRIQELEQELRAKDAELAQMRLRLSAMNSRLEQVIDRVAHEVKLAAKVQRLLTPVEIPQIPGFEFSTKFIPSFKSGGDYFDLFEHQDRLKFGVILAASSGYTMSALFLSVLLKLSSKMQARQGMEPDEMMAAVASEILPEMKDDSNASLFYGIVDRRNFELRYCVVGHVTGVIQASGQEAFVALEKGGAPLSRRAHEKPKVHTVALNAKDRLVLCSEGLIQARNGKGQSWGENGLFEAMRAAPRQGVHELRNEILYRCEAFSGLSEPDRDQTVLVLEVKDKVIKLAKN